MASGLVPGLAAKPVHQGRQLTLVTRPLRTFKIADRSHEATESWIVSVYAQTETDLALTPVAMKVSLLKGSTLLRTSEYGRNSFEGIRFDTPAPRVLPDGSKPVTPFYWPFALRLRATEPIALGVDSMRLEVTATDPAGRLSRSDLIIPVETYVQKTRLRFPFVGKGIILQAGATNGGHRNRSGLFAIDAFGLDESWSIIAPGDGKLNSDYRGFGREILAPADGVIVRAKSDRPDQPVADASDPKYYAPEHAGGGDPGNFLVIDHGNGEYSMMAHFRAGSMKVRAGDRVRMGEVLGELGHSGDTSGPHLHYQLQAGPDWEFADALPSRFSNVEDFPLDRGTYFEARM